MKLRDTIALNAQSVQKLSPAGNLHDEIGTHTVPRKTKKWKVVDTKYGHYVSDHDSYDEAKRAATARPYSKVIQGELPGQYGEKRKQAAKRFVRENPDLEVGYQER